MWIERDSKILMNLQGDEVIIGLALIFPKVLLLQLNYKTGDVKVLGALNSEWF